MKTRILIGLSWVICHFSVYPLRAQVGTPYIHDPSTIAECDGKYYTFGTGSGGLISEDGWSWHGGAERPGGGAAPDVLKIGDRYLVIYGATGGGLGGGHNGRILTMWNKTLDPKSPDFKYSNTIEVAASDGQEDCDAIDPSLLLDPTTGRLWASFGTYFGTIRLIEIDPKTGERVPGNVEQDIAIDCEATDLLYRDGWYYLLGTHGTCCDGVNSTYNIVVGRSRQVTGPYFGRTVIDEGVEVMSCHFEADLDRSGRSVLGIRPLLWQNGWPVAGEPLEEGTYEIESCRRGYSLELAVDFVRMQQERERFWQMDLTKPLKQIPNQQLDDVQGGWPEGNALAATAGAELTAVPQFTGDDEQLWRIEQLTDGTYRLMPKRIPGRASLNTRLCLYSAGDSTPTLAPYDFQSDNSKWNIRNH